LIFSGCLSLSKEEFMDILNKSPYEEYFQFLLNKVRNVDNRIGRYGLLCRVLFQKEFYFVRPRDEDRIGWARLFRDNFLMEFDETPDKVPHGPVSCLEVLISLANELDGIVYDFRYGHRQWLWFFIFLENLGLDIYDDFQMLGYCPERLVIEKLDIWMSRTYDADGNHGNIVRTSEPFDLTQMDIWDQLNLFATTVL
jgi:hypothetical protein